MKLVSQKISNINLNKRYRTAKYGKSKILYLMCIPGIILYLLFKYVPMAGIIIAFENYNPFVGISGFWTSKFVGFHWFTILFHQAKFIQILMNSLLLGFYGIIFGFPAPVILALLFNEVRNSRFRRISQSITYIPHFLSWAVVGSVVLQMLSPSGGVINQLITLFGFKAQYFAQDPHYARAIVIVSGIWKEVGWDSILYIAAIVGIDLSLYEAAIVDGASRWKQTIHITIPSIMPIITICLILSIGRILDTGFEQIYMFYNAKIDPVIDIFSTYAYRVGIGNGQFSYITALGLFNNLVGIILVLGANRISRKISDQGIW